MMYLIYNKHIIRGINLFLNLLLKEHNNKMINNKYEELEGSESKRI